ncbi:MAG TPA: ATP-binding protein [Vicinamibacterales bacterium]|nr:ATP-binding protein [Vicinamibacterales bacterium]
MKIFRSLTNRIFFGSALLAVSAIAIAIYNVNDAVSRQAEQELLRGLDEAGTLIEEYRRVLVEHFTREARLIADLPRLKAAVYTDDPKTVQPIAAEYHAQSNADLMLVIGKQGHTLAEIASETAATVSFASMPGIGSPSSVQESSFFWPHEGGILQVVSVPIWIDRQQPEILGTLSLGFSLDNRTASRFQSLTNSEIVFGMNGAIRVATLPPAVWPELTPLLARNELWPRVRVGQQEYVAATRALAATISGANGRTAATPAADISPAPTDAGATAIILRSRTARLRFLNPLHRRLAIIAVVAVLVATLLSYAIARTVTRPLGAITATMREMAATGDLTRRIAPSGAMWEDEDARLLATTFNTMTDSIARFQRDAAQRERLLSLGRLSTVVAHEIRNPLMIIRTALRSLRNPSLSPDEARAAVTDIDEETARLNRLVSEVLDFAKPIKFELAPADLNALCEDAAKAAASGAPEIPIRLRLDRTLPPVVTDAERLRLALVNVLTNARHAVAASASADSLQDPITLRTRRLARGRVTIEVADQGTGIATEDLSRVFDPYFTTRRTGTGLGLAISRNIVEGLGGTIAMSSRTGTGTEVRIELPLRSE